MANKVYTPPSNAVFSDPARNIVQSAVRRTGLVESALRTTAGTTIIYTCPQGKRSRLVFWQLYNNLNVNVTLFLNTDTIQILPNPAVTPVNTVFAIPYDDAPSLAAGDALKFTVAAGATGTNASVSCIVVEEDLASA